MSQMLDKDTLKSFQESGNAVNALNSSNRLDASEVSEFENNRHILHFFRLFLG